MVNHEGGWILFKGELGSFAHIFVPQEYMQIKVNVVKYYTMINQRSVFVTAAVMEENERTLNAVLQSAILQSEKQTMINFLVFHHLNTGFH